MAHALKRILFTMVNDKHTAFILVAKNPDSPPDLCHCHIFAAKSQTEVCIQSLQHMLSVYGSFCVLITIHRLHVFYTFRVCCQHVPLFTG